MAISSERKKVYWWSVVLLAVTAVVIGFLWGPKGRKQVGTVVMPTLPAPAYRLLAVREMPAQRQERLTIMVLVKSGMPQESLRLVLDWVLYSVLDDYNRHKGRNIQVVWTYLYEDTFVSSARWRAMAVWVNPYLPVARWPDAARVGGDALKEGAVQYDFTNPVTATDTP